MLIPMHVGMGHTSACGSCYAQLLHATTLRVDLCVHVASLMYGTKMLRFVQATGCIAATGDYLRTRRALIRAVEKQANMTEKMDVLKQVGVAGICTVQHTGCTSNCLILNCLW